MERSVPFPDASEAQAVFLRLVESHPDDPLRALAGLVLDGGVRSRVEAMVAAYLRAQALERAVVESDGEVARALDEMATGQPSEVDRSIPARIGNYRVLRTIATGGASVVVVAQQESPIEREVALKLIFEDGTDPRVTARVELERQILAALEHPGIARIYDFGLDERHRPYLVMEHVRDGSIAQWLERHPRAPRELVRGLFLPVCAAIRAAHARGVLHCDIKCANVLVQEVDGTPHPKVVDFGIARATMGPVGREAGLGDLPAALGTLRWMSPEALAPAAQVLDVRTDVFGLGLLLFEVISGQPARADHGADPAELLRVILEDPIPRLSAFVPSVDRDLDAVVARACAMDPAARYESVEALVKDLEAWLAGREVSARPLGPVRRGGRFLRRHWKVQMAVLLLGGAVVAASEIAVVPSRQRLESLAATAESALAKARSLRVVAGKSGERDRAIEEALDATAAAGAVAPSSARIRMLRDSALEEAVLARLGRNDPAGRETVRLIDALLEMREDAAGAGAGSEALERLSVALAYKSDTVRGTPEGEDVERRQLALDEELHARDPERRLYADNLCWTYQRVHDTVWQRGERERAMQLLHRSDDIAETMLARHGRTPATLYTAASAAWYRSFAHETDGRLEDAREAAKRARALAAELLRIEPVHVRGATFLFRAAISEAQLELQLGSPTRAAEILTEARAVAAPIVALERGSGFFGFPIAESWGLEARAWLAGGDADRAEFAVDMLRQEIAREREGMARVGPLVLFMVAEEALRVRIELMRGRFDRARAEVEALIVSASRATGLDRRWILDEVAAQVFEHATRDPASPESLAVVRHAAQLLDPALARLDDEERAETPRARVRSSRYAVDALLGRRAGLDAIAAAMRSHPAHRPIDEQNLRRMESSVALFSGPGSPQPASP